MIALVDCNNFFASCERLFRPDIVNKPVLVLSNNDGCVVARSEEVKALGVPMGVPYFKIRDLVKRNNIICFSSNFPLYSNMSQRVLEVFEGYAPNVEAYSIDEAFLDLRQLPIEDFISWGDELRHKVKKEVGLPVSVGIAKTKTLAKLASGYAKKQQITCLVSAEDDPEYYKKVTSATAVEDIWGIGRRLAPKLKASGIVNAWQLSKVSQEWIHSVMGINGVRVLCELRGERQHDVEVEKIPRKSLMVSRSFGHGVRAQHELEVAGASFASKAAYQLRRYQQTTGVIGVFVYYRDKNGESRYGARVMPLEVATSDTSEVVSSALQLIKSLYDEDNVYKKIGVFMHHLASENVCQTNLFDSKSQAQRSRSRLLMQSIDDINRRFGKDTVHIASIDQRVTGWHARKKHMSPAYTTEWSQIPLITGLSTRGA